MMQSKKTRKKNKQARSRQTGLLGKKKGCGSGQCDMLEKELLPSTCEKDRQKSHNVNGWKQHPLLSLTPPSAQPVTDKGERSPPERAPVSMPRVPLPPRGRRPLNWFFTVTDNSFQQYN